MRTESGPPVQSDLSFIEAARRARIVAAAIDTIAELGYGQASLARIAERIGISKGVIGYHFAGKDELISEVVAEVLARAEAYIVPRVSTESTGAGVPRTYIESNLAFMAEDRNAVVAIAEIARNARGRDGSSSFDRSALNAGAAALEQVLSRFQETGEFRADFDPVLMAMAIREAIDAVPRRLANDPALDVEHVGRELANPFDLATGKPTSRSQARRR
jgi:TetR/AcrR family transcriptional regulator, fatty acid metabolism regulator protein